MPLLSMLRDADDEHDDVCRLLMLMMMKDGILLTKAFGLDEIKNLMRAWRRLA